MKAVLPIWHPTQRESEEGDRDLTTIAGFLVGGMRNRMKESWSLFPFYIPAVNPIHLIDSSLRSMYLLQAPISLIIEQEL